VTLGNVKAVCVGLVLLCICGLIFIAPDDWLDNPVWQGMK
jgi:hypothetical protein